MKPSLRHVTAQQLKTWIHDEDELALLDVREHGQFGEEHLFFAVPLPFSELELHIGRLVPQTKTRVVLYGDQNTEYAVQASVQAMVHLGYSNVQFLDGGIEAWKAAGYKTFAGVNLPSKTFGEMAEHVYGTPRVSAEELHRLLSDGTESVLIVDGRPFPEYRKMNIPSAICCPNGELALRIGELAPDPDTTIIVNCAGRTRSIVGAQTLINLGIPNKVYALENGTQGWYLADLPLEHNSSRLYPKKISPQNLNTSRARAQELRRRFKLQHVDAKTVKRWLQDTTRSVFLCDIRTDEEHAQGDLPAIVRHTPGGQLIQATDQYIGVLKSTIVLCDTDGVRAPVIASWLKQLGRSVYLLDDLKGLHDLPQPPSYKPRLSHTRELPFEALQDFLNTNPTALVLDARPSLKFREASILGAQWITRANIPAIPARQHPYAVLLGTNRDKLALLAQDMEASVHTDIYLCIVDDSFPDAAGFPVVENHEMPDDACIDYLFFVHDRHDGNKEAARKYLEWETNLVSQIDEHERKMFAIEP